MATKTEEELASVERQRRQQIRQDAELFETFVKHPGWARFLAMIETVGQNQHQLIMKPSRSQEDSWASEYAKGALMGLSLAAQLPSAKIKEAADLNPDAES